MRLKYDGKDVTMYAATASHRADWNSHPARDEGRIFLPSASTIDSISEEGIRKTIENTSQKVRHTSKHL